MKRYFLLALVVLISLASCNKQKKEHLLGEWELLTKPLENVYYGWKFTESKVYIKATNGNENEGDPNEIDTCSSGAYVLKNGVLTLAVPEYSCRSMVYVGDWDIQNLNEDYMSLRRETDQGTQWYEFQKVK